MLHTWWCEERDCSAPRLGLTPTARMADGQMDATRTGPFMRSSKSQISSLPSKRPINKTPVQHPFTYSNMPEQEAYACNHTSTSGLEQTLPYKDIPGKNCLPTCVAIFR